MLKTLTTIALLALPSTALAADLVGDPPNLVSDPGNGWGFYIQGYGGVVTQNSLSDVVSIDEGTPVTFLFTDLLSSGSEFGVSAGVTTPIDGVSIGLDLNHTHQDVQAFDAFFEGGPSTGFTVDSTSLFATVEGAYHLNPMFDVYATGGLGATSYHVQSESKITGDDINVDTAFAPAYEVAVGLRANVTDNLSIFTEVKHSDVFSTAALPTEEDVGTSFESISAGHTAVNAGIRFNF
jgi:opacity protein-like surface antigen